MNWEAEYFKVKKDMEYYREELAKAHALLGRVVHQLSERWDTVNLTKYHPTDNLNRKRSGKDSGRII